MPRYKPTQRNGMFIPAVFEEQIQPATFEFALDHLVDQELDLTALDAKFRNDATGASAYDPRVMLKIVLLAYSRGLITSRKIERACEHNVLFMAVSGDARPSYTHIAKFVRELGPQIGALFAQVLMTCDSLGLIGKTMFAIDGVKLPCNASKERSGTHAELAYRAERLAKAAAKRDERSDNAHHKAKGEVLYDKRANIQPIKLYRPEHFSFHGDLTATCPAGKTLISNGSLYTHPSGAKVQQFKARSEDCQACA